MVEGAMRHGTDMEVEQNFVDSHGASFVGFGITRLLDFDLIARFKQINTMKLYVPGRGDQYAYPLLAPVLTRPVRWDVIANNYDLMMKYATAIRLRTASTEALLRRFTSETTHPAYAAMLEVGRAQRSIFLARWLRDRDLQRETESGLNVVENYNGVNDYIRFGKRGELASNRREEQELGAFQGGESRHPGPQGRGPGYFATGPRRPGKQTSTGRQREPVDRLDRRQVTSCHPAQLNR